MIEMSCDKCRWFNKKGFAIGFGDCVFYRFVCSLGHKVVCEHYEEYEQRPHGEWIPCKDDNFCKCSECKQIVMSEERSNFCPNCGAKMKEGKTE